MDPQMVVDIMEQSFWVALILSLPALVSALLVGVAVSIFQAVTSIQEQTLVFVPKMLAVMLALVVFFSWMQSTIVHFTRELLSSIPTLLG